jgi:hypothetical protein
MICPLKFSITGRNAPDLCWSCEGELCQAWEPKAKYNKETKQYEGDCRLFMLDRKVSGLVSTHTA